MNGVEPCTDNISQISEETFKAAIQGKDRWTLRSSALGVLFIPNPKGRAIPQFSSPFPG
jgi:hypothetical protein